MATVISQGLNSVHLITQGYQAGLTTPAAPTSLTATAQSASSIALAWTDNATNETSYAVERSPGGAGTWNQIATLNANTTTYLDQNLSFNTTYDYRVRAANSFGFSSYSNTASDTTDIPAGGLPPTITNAAITSITSRSFIATWDTTGTPSDSQVAYATAAEWGANPGVFPHVSQVDPALVESHSVLVTGLQPSTSYYVQVRSAS